jgi:hypothetical protein
MKEESWYSETDPEDMQRFRAFLAERGMRKAEKCLASF